MVRARKLTDNQREKLKVLMEGQRDELIFKEVYSDEFNVSDEEKSDEVDQANAAVANAQRLRFRNRENFYEKKIVAALRRMEEGSYGACNECDEPIGYKRLSARPTAEQCIICKEESERDESMSFIGKQSKSLGKQMNVARP
jgi:DnaK suppressor protein